MKVRIVAPSINKEELLKEIGVDERAFKILEAKSTHHILKIEDISTKEALIIKQSALSAGADAAVPRSVLQLKEEKVNILIFGTDKQLRSICEKLRMQNFSLKEVAEEIENTLDSLVRFPSLILGGKRLELKKPLIMGILNVTPDSFWDGGRYFDKTSALKHAEKMINEGADIIDIGAESTRPQAEPVPKEEELRRLLPIVKEIVKWNTIVSIDTYKVEVAKECLSLGVHMINDVKALKEEGMAELIAEHGASVVLMHMKGEPKTMQQMAYYNDVVSEVIDYLRERIHFAKECGIKEECIVIDPGIGFGKTFLHNLQILKRLQEFKVLSRPILVGPSRKSFIGQVLDVPPEERLEGTLATILISLTKGANIVRVHDVKETKRVIKMFEAIENIK